MFSHFFFTLVCLSIKLWVRSDFFASSELSAFNFFGWGFLLDLPQSHFSFWLFHEKSQSSFLGNLTNSPILCGAILQRKYANQHPGWKSRKNVNTLLETLKLLHVSLFCNSYFKNSFSHISHSFQDFVFFFWQTKLIIV